MEGESDIEILFRIKNLEEGKIRALILKDEGFYDELIFDIDEARKLIESIEDLIDFIESYGK